MRVEVEVEVEVMAMIVVVVMATARRGWIWLGCRSRVVQNGRDGVLQAISLDVTELGVKLSRRLVGLTVHGGSLCLCELRFECWVDAVRENDAFDDSDWVVLVHPGLSANATRIPLQTSCRSGACWLRPRCRCTVRPRFGLLQPVLPSNPTSNP